LQGYEPSEGGSVTSDTAVDAGRTAQPTASPQGGGLRLGSPFGIDVFLHWTFAILLVWVGWLHLSDGSSLALAVRGVLLVTAVFGCVILHELGHALMARRFGVRTLDITLYPIGGVARLESIPVDPRQELAVALAGPAVNVVLAVALLVVLAAVGGMGEIGSVPTVGSQFLASLFLFNVVLALFNLLPAFPMDGGRALRALLAMRMDRVRATRVAAGIGQTFAVVFAVAGLFYNGFLLFIALFVYLGAEQEARHEELKGALAGARVRDAMQGRFRTLHAGATLQAAVDELLDGDQHDFPVVDDDDRLVGMLDRETMIRGLNAGRAGAPIVQILPAPSRTASPTEELSEAFARMRAMGGVALPVLDQGELRGLLTVENVNEWMAVNAALERVGSRHT
jgi:Zn-dependent protease